MPDPPPRLGSRAQVDSVFGKSVAQHASHIKTSLPRNLTFAHADKLQEMAQRGEALGTLEGKQALEHAIEIERGGVYLRLTPGQYTALKTR